MIWCCTPHRLGIHPVWESTGVGIPYWNPTSEDPPWNPPGVGIPPGRIPPVGIPPGVKIRLAISTWCSAELVQLTVPPTVSRIENIDKGKTWDEGTFRKKPTTLLAQQVDQAFVLSQRTSTVVKHKTTRRHNEQRECVGKRERRASMSMTMRQKKCRDDEMEQPWHTTNREQYLLLLEPSISRRDSETLLVLY
jgi:hypothetical protein